MNDLAGADLSADAVRAEISQWITDHWDPEMPLAEWRALLADSGWACPTWPLCGRSLPPALGRVVAEEMKRAAVPGVPEASA